MNNNFVFQADNFKIMITDNEISCLRNQRLSYFLQGEDKIGYSSNFYRLYFTLKIHVDKKKSIIIVIKNIF